jgi:hypothetical protein
MKKRKMSITNSAKSLKIFRVRYSIDMSKTLEAELEAELDQLTYRNNELEKQNLELREELANLKVRFISANLLFSENSAGEAQQPTAGKMRDLGRSC